MNAEQIRRIAQNAVGRELAELRNNHRDLSRRLEALENRPPQPPNPVRSNDQEGGE